jgi:hypothetical protein
MIKANKAACRCRWQILEVAMDKLTALHVMPLLPGHEADLAADARST